MLRLHILFVRDRRGSRYNCVLLAKSDHIYDNADDDHDNDDNDYDDNT